MQDADIIFLLFLSDYISSRIKTELFPCLLPDAFRRSART